LSFLWSNGLLLTALVSALVSANELCSRLVSRGNIGDGESRRFEEATLIMDIAGAEVASLEIQRGAERVRFAGGLTLRVGSLICSRGEFHRFFIRAIVVAQFVIDTVSFILPSCPAIQSSFLVRRRL